MKKNDLALMLTVALTTATLTFVSFWTPTLEAGGEAETATPKIVKPKLSAQGVEFTLSPAPRTPQGLALSPVADTPQAGDEPVFELAALNTSTRPVDMKVRLVMAGMSPADALSRMVRLPRKLWECDQSIVLTPQERKTYTLATATRLPAKNVISVTLNEVVANPGVAGPTTVIQPAVLLQGTQPGIAVLSFSTGTGPAVLAQAQPN